MRSLILLSTLLICSRILAFDGKEPEYKRMNPWQVVMDEKDTDIPNGKAIFKVTLRAEGGIMQLQKKGEKSKEVWRSDSVGDRFHITLDTGTYTISFSKKGNYHPTTRTIHLRNQHFYEARVYIHRIRNIRTKKPAIYIYNDEPTKLNLNFEANGSVDFVYPEKPQSGWTIQTKEDGRLLVDGKSYDYLFWEGHRPTPSIDKSVGFNVTADQVIPFLEIQLTALGMNDREKQDFIAYWGPQLIKNKLNFVQFMVGESYNEHIATLDCDQQIDTEIRVFMVYESIDSPLPVNDQTFQAPVRQGLTLVEWGGGELPKVEFEN